MWHIGAPRCDVSKRFQGRLFVIPSSPELSRFTFHVDNDDDDVSEHELEAQMGGRL